MLLRVPFFVPASPFLLHERILDMATEQEAGRGKVIRNTVNGQPQIAKRRNRAITMSEKQAFLDHLAKCCNVTASAMATGRSYDGFSRIRIRDPEFAAQWQDAIEAGHATIEALMLERAHMALQAEQPTVSSGKEEEGSSEASAQGSQFALSMNADQILRLLVLHRSTVNGAKRGGPSKRAAASEDVACAAILKKLDVLRKRIDGKKA